MGQLVQIGERWRRAHKSLLARHPQKQVESANQTLDRTVSRLQASVYRFLKDHRLKSQSFEQRLQFQNPRKQLQTLREQHSRAQIQLIKVGKTTTERHRNQWLYAITKLDSLSPFKDHGPGILYNLQRGSAG